MKKVFFDTNIMIDVIGRRQPFCTPSLQIMSLADKGKLKIYVSAMSYATASYILGVQNKQMDILREFAKFDKITTSTPVDSKTIKSCLSSTFTDFEDGMQYYSALRENVDCIITRNKQDFKEAEIPVYEPQEFIDSLF